MEERSVVKYGLSLSEFWDSTPRELEILLKGAAYKQELGMNRVRHVVAALYNTVVDQKKKPKGYSPVDIMHLPLLDGKDEKDNLTEGERRVEKQKEVEKTLLWIKKQGWKPPLKPEKDD